MFASDNPDDGFVDQQEAKSCLERSRYHGDPHKASNCSRVLVQSPKADVQTVLCWQQRNRWSEGIFWARNHSLEHSVGLAALAMNQSMQDNAFINVPIVFDGLEESFRKFS